MMRPPRAAAERKKYRQCNTSALITVAGIGKIIHNLAADAIDKRAEFITSLRLLLLANSLFPATTSAIMSALRGSLCITFLSMVLGSSLAGELNTR